MPGEQQSLSWATERKNTLTVVEDEGKSHTGWKGPGDRRLGFDIDPQTWERASEYQSVWIPSELWGEYVWLVLTEHPFFFWVTGHNCAMENSGTGHWHRPDHQSSFDGFRHRQLIQCRPASLVWDFQSTYGRNYPLTLSWWTMARTTKVLWLRHWFRCTADPYLDFTVQWSNLLSLEFAFCLETKRALA